MVKLVFKFKKPNFSLNKSLLVFIFLFIYFLVVFYFKNPLIRPQYIECFSPKLPLDDLVFLTNSGCAYSFYSYLIFKPFGLVPSEYYRINLILFFMILFVINYFILSKIAHLLNINQNLFVLLSFFIFYRSETYLGFESFVMFSLFNLSIFFFLLKKPAYLFLSGVFMVLSAFKPQLLVFAFFLFALFFIDFNNKKLRVNISRNNIKSSLFFAFGFVITFVVYFLTSTFSLKYIYLSSLNRVFDFSNLLEFKLIFYILIFILALLIKNKNILIKSFILSFPLIFVLSLYTSASSRFFDFLSIIASFVLIKSFDHKKIILFLMLLLCFNSFLILKDALLFVPKSLFENQISLIDYDTNILWDYAWYDSIFKFKNLYPFLDQFVYDNLVEFNSSLRAEFINKINDFIIDKNISLVMIGPFQFESVLSENFDFYSNSFTINIPNLEHDCLTCRHVATLYFSNETQYNNFKIKLINYWINNMKILCDYSPYYYRVALSYISEFSSLNFARCNKFDLLFYIDEIKDVVNLLAIILVFLIFLSKFFSFKKK